MEMSCTSTHHLLNKPMFGMGAEERVKSSSWHVSDLHLLNPQDPVLDFFFFPQVLQKYLHLGAFSEGG